MSNDMGARAATPAEISAALRLADGLRERARLLGETCPEADALADLLAFAAIDDDALVAAARLLAAVEACGPAIARYGDASVRTQPAASGTTEATYTLTMVGARAASCTCDDHRWNPLARCKHMISAEQVGAQSPGPVPCVVGPRRRGLRARRVGGAL